MEHILYEETIYNHIAYLIEQFACYEMISP